MITLAITGLYGIVAIAALYLALMLPAVYVAAKNEQSPFLLWWMLLIVLLPVIGTVIYATVYGVRKKRKHRFEAILDNKHGENTQHPDQKPLIGIPEDTVTHILNFLDSFEKKKAYLKPEITLASDFNVSRRELRETIKCYKKKSFNGYINTLRIDYLVEELRSGSDYRKYRMKPLAKELGFGTEKVFILAFLRRTGMYPTVFIAELGFDDQEQEQQWGVD